MAPTSNGRLMWPNSQVATAASSAASTVARTGPQISGWLNKL